MSAEKNKTVKFLNNLYSYTTLILFSSSNNPTTAPAHSFPLQSATELVAKGEETKDGQHTEEDRHRLAEADGAGDGGATEDRRGEQTQLDAVGLAVLDAVAAEAVCASSGQFTNVANLLKLLIRQHEAVDGRWEEDGGGMLRVGGKGKTAQWICTYREDRR